MKIFGGKKNLEFILIAFSLFHGNVATTVVEERGKILKFKPQFLLAAYFYSLLLLLDKVYTHKEISTTVQDEEEEVNRWGGGRRLSINIMKP
jgi:hypothetical protein